MQALAAKSASSETKRRRKKRRKKKGCVKYVSEVLMTTFVLFSGYRQYQSQIHLHVAAGEVERKSSNFRAHIARMGSKDSALSSSSTKAVMVAFPPVAPAPTTAPKLSTGTSLAVKTRPADTATDELLSAGATVTTDTRGNLGPGSVITQKVQGNDWLKDRWQAASDMHGSAIAGL